MKKNILIALSLIFLTQYSIGQTILKKKGVQVKLESILIEIEKHNFENAMDIFYSKTEIIHKDNVSKKMTVNYNNISSTLTQKKAEFDKNEQVVNEFYAAYKAKKYCNATGLLTLNLTKENSYRKSQEIQSKIKQTLIQAKQKCEQNNSELTIWEENLKNKEFEKNYHILDFDNNDKNYFTSTDIERLNKLQKQLRPKYQIYKNVRNETIIKPTGIINGINYNTLTYNQSESKIQELTDISNNSTSKIQQLQGKNPNFLSEYEKTKILIIQNIKELKQFSVANRPLTDKEVSQIAFASKPITVDFIETKCKKGDADIYNIYDLDVFYYYNLKGYDSDLKKEVYKKTPEYSKQLSELKSLRTKLFTTTYYVTSKDLFKSIQYNINRKGFELTINSNWGMGTASARPPKSFSVAYGFMGDAYVQLKKLPTVQVADNFFGQGIKNEILFIPINETNGLEIEENREDIIVYYLFKPSGKETLKYKFYNNVTNGYAGWYDMTDKVITSMSLRLIVANKTSGKIYYDKVY